MMKLEELRTNDIGTIFAWIPRLGNGPRAMTHLTFPYFANNAFYYSAQQIEQLEQSRARINQGNAVQNAIGVWFISTESYINSILRIVCLLTEGNFDEIKKKDIGKRISLLLDFLGVNRLPFYQGPLQRLEEFKCYRNELFHDRTNDTPLEFKKTLFSSNPMFVNQVDVMQAAVIALDVFMAFRYVIAGLDLMPQIPVQKDDSFFHVSIIDMYEKVLKPFFKKALSKHSLVTSLPLNVHLSPLETSSISKVDEVQVLVKSEQDKKFEHTPSKQETKIGQSLLDSIRKEVCFDTEHVFKLPSYYR